MMDAEIKDLPSFSAQFPITFSKLIQSTQCEECWKRAQNVTLGFSIILLILTVFRTQFSFNVSK
jgi:hypothetical protein